MDDIKRIDIKEFREKGYLQEVNRRFLHPLGLALEVKVNDDGNETLSGIQDYRNDPEGIYYNIEESDDSRKRKFKKNKEFVDKQINFRYKDRKRRLNFEIEPIPGSPDDETEDLLTIETELEKVNSKYLSLAAEFENYKKRSLKEKTDAINNEKVKVLTSILDMDNDLNIAIKQVKNKEALEGLNLIIKKIDTFLKSQGIEEIQTEIYDDELHDVISVIPGEKNKIIDVINKGYSINGKPFRYPKVVLGNG